MYRDGSCHTCECWMSHFEMRGVIHITTVEDAALTKVVGVIFLCSITSRIFHIWILYETRTPATLVNAESSSHIGMAHIWKFFSSCVWVTHTHTLTKVADKRVLNLYYTSHFKMWHALLTRVVWLISMCTMPWSYVWRRLCVDSGGRCACFTYVLHIAFLNVTCLIHTRDMTPFCMCAMPYSMCDADASLTKVAGVRVLDVSLVVFLNVTCRTHTCDMTHFHMCAMPHSYVWHSWFVCATERMPTCVPCLLPMCDMSHSHVRHVSFPCATWLIPICVPCLTPMCYMPSSYVRHDSFLYVCHAFFLYVTCLIPMCDMTHSYMCAMPPSYVRHVSFPCATWLIPMCDMTHFYMCAMPPSYVMCDMPYFYVWHDLFLYIVRHASFLCVTCLIPTCDLTQAFACVPLCVCNASFLKRHASFVYVRHDSFLCATWLIPIHLPSLYPIRDKSDLFLRCWYHLCVMNWTHELVDFNVRSKWLVPSLLISFVCDELNPRTCWFQCEIKMTCSFVVDIICVWWTEPTNLLISMWDQNNLFLRNCFYRVAKTHRMP